MDGMELRLRLGAWHAISRRVGGDSRQMDQAANSDHQFAVGLKVDGSEIVHIRSDRWITGINKEQNLQDESGQRKRPACATETKKQRIHRGYSEAEVRTLTQSQSSKYRCQIGAIEPPICKRKRANLF